MFLHSIRALPYELKQNHQEDRPQRSLKMDSNTSSTNKTMSMTRKYTMRNSKTRFIECGN